MKQTNSLDTLKHQIKMVKKRLEILKQHHPTTLVLSEIKKDTELLRVLNNHLKNETT